MYPDDQQPPHNNNAMGQPPSPFVLNQPNQNQDPEKQKKRMPTWLWWVIGGVVFLITLVIVIVMVVNSGNKDKNDDTTNTTQTPSKTEEEPTATGCKSKERRYQNEDLDMRFCYPSAWGDVKVSDGKFDPSDNGTRVLISFADKASVHLGLVSDDWSTGIAREGVCVSPGAQAFPSTGNFSAKWITEGAGQNIISAVRGLEVIPDEYLLQERVDNVLTNGVCLEGYKAFNGEVYRNAEATIYTEFSDKVKTPAQHINDPKILISVADRTDLTNFVKSIEKY